MTAHHPDMSHHNMQDKAPGFRAIRWNMDWILRPLFGIALALVAIGALWGGPVSFACLVAAMGLAASFEWHRMVAQGQPYRTEAIVTAAALAIGALGLAMNVPLAACLAVVGLAAAALAVQAFRHGQVPVWHVLGVLYLAIPSLALVALAAQDKWLIVGLFVIVWATDSGALICGNLIGGPRMAPVLSPSKTWAGTIGGSVIAALAFALFIFLRGGAPGAALAIGFGFSLIAHAGDLFESFVKRRFGIKNSGSIIPGHGGVLDRMDSSLAAGMAMALLVFAIQVNPLIGVHP